MNKVDMVHIYNEILFSHKNEQSNAICSNIDATRNYHTSEVRKTNTIWYHLYVKSKIWHKWTYLWKNKKTKSKTQENKLLIAKGERAGREVEWEFGVRRCKLLYIEWITVRSYCIAQRTLSIYYNKAIMEKKLLKDMHNWTTLLYSSN